MKSLEQLIKRTILKRAIRPLVGIGSLMGTLGLSCEPDNPTQKVIYVYPDAYVSESGANPASTDAQSECQKYFEDKDNDGYGNYKSWVCEPLSGYVNNGNDCNDYDQLVHQGASDYCGGDGIDNNCNGKIDEEGISHYQKGCFNGDVYWLDSCGSVEDLLEKCVGNYICEEGGCAPKPNCLGVECGSDEAGGSCGICDDPYTNWACVKYGCLCINNKCFPDYSKYDSVCENAILNQSGYCEIDKACVPWCKHEFDHNEKFCCPFDKPNLVAYNTLVPPAVIYTCCSECYPSYSFTELPSNCVEGTMPTEY